MTSKVSGKSNLEKCALRWEWLPRRRLYQTCLLPLTPDTDRTIPLIFIFCAPNLLCNQIRFDSVATRCHK